MAQLAVADLPWITVDTWESDNPEWTRTVSVLHHVREAFGPVAHVSLVCGSDLIKSFEIPNLWAKEDVRSFVALES